MQRDDGRRFRRLLDYNRLARTAAKATIPLRNASGRRRLFPRDAAVS